MATKFNARLGVSVGSTPVDIIDSTGNITANTITSSGNTYLSGVNISNGNTVTAVTVTASGIFTSLPTATISAPTTAGGVQATFSFSMQITNVPTITAGGTGYTVNDVLTFVGGTTTAAGQLTVTSVSGGVITGVSVTAYGAYTVLPSNPISVTGGTGTGATFTATWGVRSQFPTPTITNAGSGYVEQPTVTFSGGGVSVAAAAYATVGSIPKVQTLGSAMSFYTPSGEAFRILDIGSTSTTYWGAMGSGATPYLTSYSGSSDGFIQTNGAANIRFRTNYGSTAAEQLRVAHTASAVNYVQVAGGATGANPTISAQGSDTNRSLALQTKGDGYLYVTSSTGYTHFRVYSPSVVATSNFIQITGAASTGSPVFTFQGSDTNVSGDINLKGSGSLSFRSFDGSNRQFRIEGSVASVNYLQVTGNILGSAPALSAQGADTDIDLQLTPKGAGKVTTSAMYIPPGGTLSVGTTATGSAIQSAKTFLSATGGEQFGMFGSTAYNIADTGLKQGLRLNTSAGHTSGVQNALFSQLNLTSVGGVGGRTVNAYGYWSRVDVTTGAYLDDARAYHSEESGGTGYANTQYGFYASNMQKSPLNFGFYGNVSKGANTSYNLYMNGNAPNYLAGDLRVANTTASTSNTTGAVIVSGGLGVAGNVYATSVYVNNIDVRAITTVSNTLVTAALAGSPLTVCNNATYTLSTGTSNFLQVYVDGYKLVENLDYTETTTTSITPLISIPVGSTIEYLIGR